MDSPYQGSSDVHVLPTNLTLPGVGVTVSLPALP